MSIVSRLARPDPRTVPAPLQAAFDTAMAFPTSRALTLQPPAQTLAEAANQETSFGRIMVDDQGLTAGTRLHVLEPARALLAEWREARRPFDVAIEPMLDDVHAVQRVGRDIATLSARRHEELEQAEQQFAQDHRFRQVKDSFDKAQHRFHQLELRHGNRAANMGATWILYWLGLVCLGAVEWLINYDIFFLFTNIAAIAAGATIVMGVLLAFAAHGHGMILKQWPYRFGQDKPAADRASDWRLLALSSFSLLIVLGAAAGSRYAVVMHQMAGASSPNLLGAENTIEFNPGRDILLSLLWNLMAWAAGVFLSYFAHDKDPDYMDATAQWRRTSRSYHRYRRPQVDRMRTIEARYATEKTAHENAAASRSGAVQLERKLLEQVEAHEEALVNAIAGVTRNAAQAYHAALAQLAISQRGALTIERAGGAELGPNAFRAQPVMIDAATIRSLA